MAVILTLRFSPAKLARIERRAAELGRDRSTYIRALINQDLKHSGEARDLKFVSGDVMEVFTSQGAGDNAKGRRVTRERLRRREKIRKSFFETAAKGKSSWSGSLHMPHHD